MTLEELVARAPLPEPWVEGDNIPWDEPEFSARMLREHLSQEHDLASRRTETVTRHLQWIHEEVLGSEPSRVLDMACGPGLYASGLARLGHSCRGVDFSPASVAYARDRAAREALDCEYVEADLREAELGSDYDLAMLIFGQLNVFQRGEARAILSRARQALRPGGHLLLEPHTPEAVEADGGQGTRWISAAEGLFSDQPHLCLEEHFWDAEKRTSTTRFYVVDAATGTVEAHAMSMEAYTEDEYRALLRDCGFGQVAIHPSLGDVEDPIQEGLMALVGTKDTDP